MTGQIAPEKVNRYLVSSDIFIFPSKREGMSNSLLEAVLTGIPVIASDIPPNRELLAKVNGSLLVNSDSSDAYFEGLLDMVRSLPQRKELANKSAHLFAEQYSLNAITAAYERTLFQ